MIRYIGLFLVLLSCHSSGEKDDKVNTKILLDTSKVLESTSRESLIDRTRIVDDINYMITDTRVGLIHRGMTIGEVIEELPAGRIKKVVGEGEFHTDKSDDYFIYDISGKHILTITPLVEDDMKSLVNRVEIISDQFKTKKGIGIRSTYSDLFDSYDTIQYIPSREHIVISISEVNAWFLINKSNLEDGWWNSAAKTIDRDKIPLNTQIDNFIVWWPRS